MILLLFLVMAASLAQNTMSLIRLSNCFDALKKDNPNNSALLQQCSSYNKACKDAYKAIQKNRPVADHVWYRVEIARTIYKYGFEFFKNNIEQYLFDWSALVRITNKQVTHWQDLSHDWAGTSAYFSDHIFQRKRSVNVSDNERFRLKEGYEEVRLYDNLNELLLTSPSKGIFFYHYPYYGSIDYITNQAILYETSNNIIQRFDYDRSIPTYKTEKIDFSNLVPWNVLKIYGTDETSIFFNQNKMCLTFWNNLCDAKSEGQIVYQIRRSGEEVDLSLPQNYKSSDKSIHWIDGSCNFSKYSHAWFSFYFFQFFLKHLVQKSVRQKSLLNRYCCLAGVSAFFLGFIAAHGICGVFLALSLSLQPSSFIFKDVSELLSSFSALFLISCVLRGLYQDIYG